MNIIPVPLVVCSEGFKLNIIDSGMIRFDWKRYGSWSMVYVMRIMTQYVVATTLFPDVPPYIPEYFSSPRPPRRHRGVTKVSKRHDVLFSLFVLFSQNNVSRRDKCTWGSVSFAKNKGSFRGKFSKVCGLKIPGNKVPGQNVLDLTT